MSNRSVTPLEKHSDVVRRLSFLRTFGVGMVGVAVGGGSALLAYHDMPLVGVALVMAWIGILIRLS